MKRTRLLSALFALFLVGIFIIPANAAKEVTVQRNISKFSKLKVSSAIQLVINPGESDKLTIEAMDNELSSVVTKVEKGRLILEIKGQFFNTSHHPVKITIQVNELTKIDGTGAANIVMNLKNKTNKFKLDLAGASYFKGTLEANSSEIELSGVSKAEIAGTSIQCEIDLSGASECYAQKLVIENCDLEASGASKGYINVTKTLEAETSGASKLFYSGNPVTTLEHSGTSSITKNK